MIEGLFNTGSLPVLERMVQFTSQRHKLLVNDIANVSTPGFVPTDVDPRKFQAVLAAAIDQRRQTQGGIYNGTIHPTDTEQMRFTDDTVQLAPSNSNDNILFHDGNNRSLESIMKDLAENTMAHNAGIEMIRNQMNLMDMAIRERV
ncbi:MAG: flagellar basal body rod protein FlgB [Phycisphaeraceae bacterium]